MTRVEARVWLARGRDEAWPDHVFVAIARAHPDLLHDNVHHRRLSGLLASLAQGRDVLEAGCSTGALSELAMRHGARSIVGLDIGRDRLRKARLRFDVLSQVGTFIEADLQRPWPIRSGTIDLVVCSEVIEHLQPERQERFLREAHRVLRPDGTCVLTTPNVESWFVTASETSGAWSPHHHWGELDRAGLMDLYGRTGFQASVDFYRYPKVNRLLRRRDWNGLADWLEQVPPRRKLAMNLLGIGRRTGTRARAARI